MFNIDYLYDLLENNSDSIMSYCESILINLKLENVTEKESNSYFIFMGVFTKCLLKLTELN